MNTTLYSNPAKPSFLFRGHGIPSFLSSHSLCNCTFCYRKLDLHLLQNRSVTFKF
ncbi:hypothetical protein GLYMA_10G217250v4 [Glycine max]|nr:hypothetical protein GLYMA_10G217250v4 [Glycine max]KAH1139470.1 hypothetical protein GYH30_028732 [Glycine max]